MPSVFFKSGGRRLIAGVGAFDSHTLPPEFPRSAPSGARAGSPGTRAALKIRLARYPVRYGHRLRNAAPPVHGGCLACALGQAGRWKLLSKCLNLHFFTSARSRFPRHSDTNGV